MDLLHLPHVRGKRANDVSPRRPRRRPVTLAQVIPLEELLLAGHELNEARADLGQARSLVYAERRAWAFEAAWRKAKRAEDTLEALATEPALRRLCAAQLSKAHALADEASRGYHSAMVERPAAAIVSLAAVRARRTAAAASV